MIRGGGRIVDVCAGGRSAPFVVVHPVGGTVHFLRRFAELLESRRPVLGIEARGIDGREYPHATIEEMAEDYVERLRERVPGGPYLLGGSSMGGLVAYEMARVLARRDEPASFVALFDTYGPGYPRRLRGAAWASDYARYVRSLPAGSRARFLANEVGSRVGMPISIDAPRGGVEMPIGWARTFARVERALVDAAERYEAGPYDGDVHLFRATSMPTYLPGRCFADRTNGFDAIVRGRVHVHDVVGPHAGFFDPPYVEELVRVVERAWREHLPTDAEGGAS